ncbi:MAG: NADH-quinone oxidoreductase subunit NuoF [Verrucomicrobiota bacterium]
MKRVITGMGMCGVSAGARAVQERLEARRAAHAGAFELSIAGCIGMCYREPLVEIREDGTRAIFGDVTPDRAEELVERYVLKDAWPSALGASGHPPPASTFALRASADKSRTPPEEGTEPGRSPPLEGWPKAGVGPAGDFEPVYWEKADGSRGGSESEFLAAQQRIVLRNCGTINPESIQEYIQAGGYTALRKALSDLTPASIIEEVKASGLRGRGGAGFPTGLKWSFTAASKADRKYVVCNADEGDPGAFMDRSVLESDPHSVIEGMIICARAVGADSGYIYCRAEYPLALHRLEIALEQARSAGYLGRNILGSGLDFDVKIKQGAGAFVCGEETALFQSIEGHRGMPRIRPPFPAEKGLWQKPTNNNNVETYANIPWILIHGAKAYAAYGTEKSRGTKVFALAGKVARGGLAEVACGTTIRDLVNKIGGGIKGGRRFKAVQMGGPSGGCIPAELGDTPVDFESIPRTGAIMGSGGMVVLDDTACMVEIARFFLDFTQKESCGKCTFCRIGTLRLLEVLERITQGDGRPEDLEKLSRLALQVKDASLCGLGQTAPNPVLTTLKYFRNEYEAHIKDRKCPAAHCNALVDFFIDPIKCTGCTLCAKQCPVKAISGKPKEKHVIDTAVCAKCGKCVSTCNFDAIYKA